MKLWRCVESCWMPAYGWNHALSIDPIQGDNDTLLLFSLMVTSFEWDLDIILHYQYCCWGDSQSCSFLICPSFRASHLDAYLRRIQYSNSKLLLSYLTLLSCMFEYWFLAEAKNPFFSIRAYLAHAVPYWQGFSSDGQCESTRMKKRADNPSLQRSND